MLTIYPRNNTVVSKTSDYVLSKWVQQAIMNPVVRCLLWSNVSWCIPLCMQMCVKTYLPGGGALPYLSSYSLLTIAPPVFSRPNWPCRSSWPRVWQLASCPAPSPHQLCAQWRLTHWLCATQWAPLPSSRPPSWALHCSGLPQGHCGPHTHPSSFLLTKDLTCSPSDLHPCPFTKPQALL